ncbi:MAG: hypothetical protein JWN76_1014 [Chitinophagaceae bacterium]|nr:hypothetical protein [Chitinophagaceae bacterium]
MKVVLIGSGNVATVLAHKMVKGGNSIIQVFSRNTGNAQELAASLNATFINDITLLNPEGDIYILAVSDDVLPILSKEIYLDTKLVVHTTGSASIHILEPVSKNYGVLYPLQSLRKNKLDAAVPLLIDGSDEKILETIRSFAETLSPAVEYAGDEQRLKLHVAAVFVSNFVNHLYALGERFCDMEELPFNILYPLIEETATRLKEFSPNNMQTGPAVRGDGVTINAHAEILSAYPNLQKIYLELTESIINFSRVK